MATLCEPDDYEAFIVNSATQETMVQLPWSDIKWGRQRCAITDGSVTVPFGSGGIECCKYIAGLFPWSQMLRIERNGSKVWDGPVMSWKTDPQGNFTLSARDRWILTTKRRVGAPYLGGGTPAPPFDVIQSLLTGASVGTAVDPYSFLLHPLSSVLRKTETILREYRVERLEPISSAIDEICANTFTGFFTMVNENYWLHETPVRNGVSAAGVLFGPGPAGQGSSYRLAEDTMYGLPSVSVDGSNMATYAYVGGAGQGVNGYPLIGLVSRWYQIYLQSVLEEATTSSRSGSLIDLTLAAGRLAVDSATPGVTIEQVKLRPSFGAPLMNADLSNLLPGQQVEIDFEETCAFNVPFVEYGGDTDPDTGGPPYYRQSNSITAARIDKIEFNVSRPQGGGITEEVQLSLRPTVMRSATDVY